MGTTSSRGSSFFLGSSTPCRISPPPNMEVYKCRCPPHISCSGCFDRRKS
jgi:hypothetical protein